MKEEYNKLFAKAVPRMSDEELFEKVLNSGKANIMGKDENQTKKRGKRAMLIPLVAAVTVAATSLGAFAIYNISAQYDNAITEETGAFEQEYKDKDGNVIDAKAQARESGVYEALNIEVNKSFNFDGGTLEIPAAISDGKNLDIMYSVVFDEEPDERDTQFSLVAEYMEDFRQVYGGVDGRTFSKRDGKTVYTSFIDFTGVENRGDSVKIKLTELSGNYTGHEGGFEFNIELEIPLKGDLARFNKTVEVPSEPRVSLGEWGEWKIANMEITPLEVIFDFNAAGEVPHYGAFKLFNPDIPLIINFKDGSSLYVTTAIGSQSVDEANETLNVGRYFNYPIIVEDVQSVQYASAEIDVSGNVTTVDTPKIVADYTGNNFIFDPKTGVVTETDKQK